MITAVSDRIILIPDPIQDNINGVLIPETSQKKPMKGMVVSAGIDCKEIKIGYEVTFLQGHGVTITEDGVEKLILREQDVLGYTNKNEFEEIEKGIIKATMEFAIHHYGNNFYFNWGKQVEGMIENAVREVKSKYKLS